MTTAVAPLGLELRADAREDLLGLVLDRRVDRRARAARRAAAGFGSRTLIGSPSASRTMWRSPSTPCSSVVVRVLEARRGPCRRCRPCRAPATRASRAGRRGGSRARRRGPRCSARGSCAPACSAGGGRGRRSRCRGGSSCSRTSSSGWPSSGAIFFATPFGSLTRYGVALTSSAGSVTASSTPRRSTISPRRAGTLTRGSCWVTAALRSDPAWTVPSHIARSPAMQQEGEEGGEEEADASLDQRHALLPRCRGRPAGACGGAAPSCPLRRRRRAGVGRGVVGAVLLRGRRRGRRGGGRGGRSRPCAAGSVVVGRRGGRRRAWSSRCAVVCVDGVGRAHDARRPCARRPRRGRVT